MANAAGKQSASPTTGRTAAKAAKSPGQRVSRERGTATNHKKNPGKRPRQGGGSR